MATWSELQALRLKIVDPTGIVGLETVASASSLPASPLRQTAYRKEDTAEYVRYDFDLGAWEDIDIELADAVLNTLIDLYGVAKAAPRAIRQIVANVGRRLGIARVQAGAESVDYINLSTLYGFYKDVASAYEEETAQDEGTNVGRYIRAHHVEIGGGYR